MPPTTHDPVGWRVNLVKQGILLGFKFGDTVDASMDHGRLPFFDKDTLPMRNSPSRQALRACLAALGA